MPRYSTKRRKGFHGKKKWEIVHQESATVTSDNDAEVDADEGPNPSTTNPCGTCKTWTPRMDTVSTGIKSISAEKLLNTDFLKIDDKISTRASSKKVGMSKPATNFEEASGFKIQDFSLLQQCLDTSAICSKCKSAKSNLKIFQVNKKRKGLGEYMFIKCSNCGASQDFLSSKKMPCQGGGFEINKRAALASSSRKDLKRFCSRMNLPPPVLSKPYNRHLKTIEEAAVHEAEEKMNDAAARLIEITRTEEPSKIVKLESGKEVAQVSVTVDGTWQKRGHTSKIGVVFILSVRTGEVLDYEVLSQVCHECIYYNKHDKESSFYKEWAQNHSNNCRINHEGSSGKMEGRGATLAFKRSIEKRCLMYTQFVGDGDSSCFGTVLEAVKEEFGDLYPVEKEECVGHIQKRMGSALLDYKKSMKGRKLSDGKGVGGAHRLTEDMIKRIQNYYGLSVRQNKGDLLGMKKAITAIQYHIIDEPGKSLSHQHRFCPQGKDSWCRFWADKATGSSSYKDTNRLPHVFMAQLQPIFTRLSDSDLLSRCLLGLTQNQNESLNGRLWSLVPKTTFCGKRRIVIAVCETICVSNTGAASNYMLFEKLGIEPGENTLRALRQEDRTRLQNASRKISEKYRVSRKRLKFQKRKKEKRPCSAYKAGGFGTMAVPDQVVTRKGKEKGKQKRKQNISTEIGTLKRPRGVETVEVMFVDETTIDLVTVGTK